MGFSYQSIHRWVHKTKTRFKAFSVASSKGLAVGAGFEHVRGFDNQRATVIR